jgi:hypothetical protein
VRFSISLLLIFCPLCNSDFDSLGHLFFRCSFARIIWRDSFWPLDSLVWSNFSMSDWLNCILNPFLFLGLPKSDVHLFQIFASVFCDLLWFNRNKVVHDGIIPDALSLSRSIKKVALDHLSAWKGLSSSPSEKWLPPAANSYKINFDTAVRDSFSAQSAVCRDSNGKIIKALSKISPPCDPTYGEALAMSLAVSLAVSLNISKFILEGDSLIVIMALQHPSLVLDWKIENIIADSIAMIPPSSSWKARKVHRSANFCAHHVAYWAAARAHSGCIPTHLPHSPSFPICSGKDPPPC